ncbi:hypothetical protein H5410_057600 [Solanum commersonii]|uniref:Uncharacterized protein n=1 Tax=Solanum commersonii TaxID=4109 RepID=A0A9J5WPG3_SOLCO|nr:hypothetical protein H5410_057600 [Solanum commersonii]
MGFRDCFNAIWLGSEEVHQSSVGLNGRRTDSKGGEWHQSQVLERCLDQSKLSELSVSRFILDMQ